MFPTPASMSMVMGLVVTLDFQRVKVRGTGPDGRWYQSIVEAPFDYDEVK